jgi:TonB family protein
MEHRRLALSAVSFVMLTTAVVAGDQDHVAKVLADVKGLYEAAEYDAALVALRGIDSGPVTSEQTRDRAMYRALCLLANNHQSDAEAAVEELLQSDPLFTVGVNASPRWRAIVDGVRDRIRPTLVQKHYSKGRALFDRHEYRAAREEFTVAQRLAEQGADKNGSSSIADLRTLATEYGELSRRMLASPSLVAQPMDSTPSSSAAAFDKAASPTFNASPGAAPASVGISPPVPVRQDIPPWPSALTSTMRNRAGPLTCELEVAVSENGDVSSVKLVKGIHPAYDSLLLAAARRWKYQPATRGGKALPFVKRLVFNITLH